MANLIYHPKKQFCSRGHEIVVVGRTKFGQCISCKKINDSKTNANPEIKVKKKQWAEEHLDYWPKYQEEHKDELLQAATEYYESNKEACLARMKIWNLENKDRVVEHNKEYYEEHKEEILAHNKKYRQEHPEIINAYKIKSQTNRGLRVPEWADWDNIKVVYAVAHSQSMEVDHIIPLQGDEVSGLHVSWNLKPTTPEENRLKYNYIDLNAASEWYGNILKEAGLK